MDGHLREDSIKTQNWDKERMVIPTNFWESVMWITEWELVWNRLSIDEALKIAMDWNCFSDTSYLKTFLMWVKYCKNAKNIWREVDKIDDYDWAIDSIRGRNILEIWAWEIPFNRQIECWEYIWLDPFTWWIWWILKVDWLNFLRWCQDNFASIVSFWVIDDDIILIKKLTRSKVGVFRGEMRMKSDTRQ